MAQSVYNASHRSYVEGILSKNIPPHLETPIDIATKSGETHVWDRTVGLPSCKFLRRSARDIRKREK